MIEEASEAAGAIGEPLALRPRQRHQHGRAREARYAARAQTARVQAAYIKIRRKETYERHP